MKFNTKQIEYLNKNSKHGNPIMVRVGENWYTWNEEQDGHISLVNEKGKTVKVLPTEIDQITEGIEQTDIIQEIEDGIRKIVKEELNEEKLQEGEGLGWSLDWESEIAQLINSKELKTLLKDKNSKVKTIAQRLKKNLIQVHIGFDGLKDEIRKVYGEGKLNETKFYAFWKNKKHTINGKSLYDAKQQAITKLKIPKSKVGLLAVVNAGEHDKGSFKFEGKLKEGVNQSYKQMLNLMKNAIPMMFRREEGGLEKKYHDSIMNNGDVGVFIQALHYGKPEAMKLWPKVEKIVKKNLDNFYKEDVKEKQKENTERNKLWMMLGKYAKKLKV